MSDKCSTVQQGYPSMTTHTDCLSHTGFDLGAATFLAVGLILAALILLYLARRGRA